MKSKFIKLIIRDEDDNKNENLSNKKEENLTGFNSNQKIPDELTDMMNNLDLNNYREIKTQNTNPLNNMNNINQINNMNNMNNMGNFNSHINYNNNQMHRDQPMYNNMNPNMYNMGMNTQFSNQEYFQQPHNTNMYDYNVMMQEQYLRMMQQQNMSPQE